MRRLGTCACIAAVLLSARTYLCAQFPDQGAARFRPRTPVPRFVEFRGDLTPLRPKDVGKLEITFSVYSTETGGTAIWQEAQTVPIDPSGRYVVLLGATTLEGLPANLFTSGDPRWLGVRVGQEPERPRTLLVSVPYALKAGDADTVGGMSPSEFLTKQEFAAQASSLSSGSKSSTSSASPPATSSATPSSTSSSSPAGGLDDSKPGNFSLTQGSPFTTQQGLNGLASASFSDTTSTAVVFVNQSGTGSALNASSASGPAAIFDVLQQPTGTTGTILVGQMAGQTRFAFDLSGNLAAGGLTLSGPVVVGSKSVIDQNGNWVGSPTGLVGPQGPQGPAGATGPQGLQGVAGATGATGPMGLQGLQGPIGAPGPQGPQGFPGQNGTSFRFRNGFVQGMTYLANDVVAYQGNSYIATGTPTGAPGTDPLWALLAAGGSTGPQGPAGPTGAAGPQGPTGATGPAGMSFAFRNGFDAGKSYAVNDVVTYQGSSYIAIATPTVGQPPSTDTAEWSLLAAEGSTGPAGATGAMGPVGPTGAAGAMGAQGPIGLTGATGPAGPIGPQGPQGVPGQNGTSFMFRNGFDAGKSYAANDVVTYQGSSYIAIATPTVGLTPSTDTAEWSLLAAEGSTGPAGATGAMGPVGSTGATGAMGPQGPIGLTGATGPAGPTGLQGPQGVPGQNGTSFTFLNAFNPAASYVVDDVVTYQGSSYIAIGTPSGVPGVDSMWSLLAAEGATGPAGATGAAGPQGPAGSTGSQGPKGDAGAQGPAGPAGPTGAIGMQGAVGPQGPPGPIGLTGPAGPQGPTGAVGPAGTSFSFDGPFNAGTSYATNAVVSYQGSSYIATGTPTGVPGVDATWSLLAAQGGVGATGPQGTAGPTGATGSQGPKGDTGAQGSAGPVGPMGATGAQGAVGPQGPAGPIGLPGPPGPQGPQGAVGAAGTSFTFDGPFSAGTSYAANAVVTYQGSSYIASGTTSAVLTPLTDPAWSLLAEQGGLGATGPQGPAGPTGATGSQGPKGDTGAQGPAGPTGQTGATGAQGVPGAMGPQGPIGNTGAAGPQGVAGPAGPQGPTGQNGTSFIFSGPFSAGTSYVANDVVTYQGSSYIAIGATSASLTPLTDPEWSLLAEQGATGAAGASGTQGAQGQQGPQGPTGPIGPQGLQGLTGATGPQGPQGPPCTSNGTLGDLVTLGQNGNCTDSGTSILSVATATSPTTFTNKTFDAEGAGNSLSIPTKAFFAAAGCTNLMPASNWDLGGTNFPAAACQGVTSTKGVLQFAHGNTAYINFELPSDWNANASVDIRIAFTTSDTSAGHVTAWDVQTGCNKMDGSMTDDPALNAAQVASVSISQNAAANGQYVAALAGLTRTGCQAGANLVLAITRDNSGADTNIDTAVAAKWVELTFRRIF